MEESSERRKERLRAMREEAIAARSRGEDAEADGAPSLSLPTLSGEPPPQQPLPASSPARFEFYTDPVAAFTGSQRKKIRDSSSSSSRSFATYQASRPSFSTPQQAPPPVWQPNVYTAVTPPPRSFNTRSPGYDTGFGLRSPNPSSGSHSYHSPGFRSPSLPFNSPHTSPAQSFPSTEIHDNYDLKAQSYGNSPGVRGNFWAGSSRSPGGRGSPAANRDSRGLGRSGSRNNQRPFKIENVSAKERPDLFVKKSMILDPWKDLAPVRLDSIAFRMDNFPESTTTEKWLPKSIQTKKPKDAELKISPAPSGPSLAESLAASLADAVSGYD